MKLPYETKLMIVGIRNIYAPVEFVIEHILPHFEAHEEQFQPVLEQLRKTANANICIKHSEVHRLENSTFEECDYLAKWQVKPDPFEVPIPKEASHYQSAKSSFDGLKEKLRLEEHGEFLRELQQQDPDSFRRGSLEREPYSCLDSEIPDFDDMVTNVAKLFDNLYVEDLWFLLNFVASDEHGVLFLL